MIDKSQWTWMPHPAHFICSFDCRFHLAMRVGRYLISSIGEYFPDAPVREIIAESMEIELKGRGDMRKADFLKRIGYQEIGYARKYETMVFYASLNENPEHQCCPYRIESGNEIESCGANTATEAYNNHMKMCEMYAEKQ